MLYSTILTMGGERAWSIAMARPLGIQFENACYPITSRWNSRQKIFADGFDRKVFLDLLVRSRETYRG
jgi:hypothetical protein